ncbi:MAG TPA: type II toxin-antitoxin system RelE/ParE family toxin [Candidatus Thermoplasmatota archaeon]|nr:type II toxin-antitoxin system RelE/ParE family toxin [Candidatus Thermoplasmatota archaeon]
MPARVRLLPLGTEAFRSLAPEPKRAVAAAMRGLAADDARLDVRPLVAPGLGRPLVRLRAGEWRVVFVREGRTIVVARIFHRREGYAWLDRWAGER